MLSYIIYSTTTVCFIYFLFIVPLNILNVNIFTQNIEYAVFMEVFALRLKELRMEKGMSQANLAKLVGSSCSIVCYWETNRSEPTAPYLVKLAEIFNVSVDYLLGRADY